MCNCDKFPYQHWHAGMVDISPDLFRQALGFPEGTVITELLLDPRKIGVVTLRVEHPDLPTIPEGATVMQVTPLFKLDPETNKVQMVEWSPGLPAGESLDPLGRPIPDYVQGAD